MATGDIPKVRAEMEAYADAVQARMPRLADQLRDWAAALRRDRHVPGKARATARSDRSMTDDEIKDVIRAGLLNATQGHPVSNRALGRRFGVDGGRVSDYLGSKRNERLDRLREEVRNELQADRQS